MTELDLWNHLWMASGSNATWFIGLGFLSWVGLSAGQNIYCRLRQCGLTNKAFNVNKKACLKQAFFLDINYFV